MIFPKIIAEECATNTAPDPSCVDARCADPAFAAANPLICSAAQLLELRPGFEIICTAASLQFTAWLKSGDGQIQLTAGVSYSSSDNGILIVDPQTGAATTTGPGIASVTATYSGLVAQAQITVLGGEADCCAGIEVDMAVLLDNSQSMGQTFATISSPGGPFAQTKANLARQFANTIRNAADYAKDKQSLSWFNETAATPGPLGSTATQLFAALNSFPGSTSFKTNIPAGQTEALSALGFDGSQSSPGGGGTLQRVIFVISDGLNTPALSTSVLTQLLSDADTFKATGGIIFCIGIRAAGDGFTLLQRLATGGFFLNVLGSQVASLSTVNGWITSLICSFCGGDRTTDYSSCVAPDIGVQVPDPDPLPNIESGETGGGGGGGTGPTLPSPSFTPASGTAAAPFTVALAVPNHPNAHIRFTLKEDGSQPADPNFLYPSAPATGVDYDGQNVPVAVAAITDPWKTAYLKAVAREAGFQDSDVASVGYPAGVSNNTNAMVINDVPAAGTLGKATTYPSVKYVTGASGHITKVVAKLIGFDHTWPSDVWVLLVSPAGTGVLLMADCGGSIVVSGVDLNFDDTGGAIPVITNVPPGLVTGTYKPTSYLPLTTPPFPPPAPVGPYHPALSAFIGETPNGLWQLFVIDSQPVNSGHIAAGWSLALTTA